MILVSGATGNVGGEIVRVLSARGVHFRAMVRSDHDARAFSGKPGIEPVVADFDDEATLATALTGVERAFLLTPSTREAEARQRRFVDIAASAGVRHIVKQSQLHANVESPVRFLRYHAVIEEAIRASGMDWTFLRPNLFMQGLLMLAASIAIEHRFAIAAGDAGVSAVDVRDIAAAATAALTEPGHAGKTYDLTGPAALTHAEMAAQLAHALDHPVEFLDLDEVTMREALRSHGMPDWMAEGLVEDYAHYRRGEASGIADGVQAATGKAPRAFATFARDYAQAFAQAATKSA
jgi:uncharacterized protein YbjT (DUF2867 family)